MPTVDSSSRTQSHYFDMKWRINALLLVLLIYDSYLCLSSVHAIWYWLFANLDWKFAILAIIRDLSPTVLLVYSFLISGRRIQDALKGSRISHEGSERIFGECLGILSLGKDVGLWVVDSGSTDAFAFRSGGSSVVVVTRGLIERLSEDELKGVLCHELTHVKNGDHSIMTWANSLVHVYWSFLPLYLIALVFTIVIDLTAGTGRPVWIATNACVRLLMVFVIPMLLVNSLSRAREFVADLGGLAVTRDYPRALVKSMIGFQSIVKTERLSLLSTSAEHLPRFLDTHPSVKDRLASLSKGGAAEPSHLLDGFVIGMLVGITTLLLTEVIPSSILFLAAEIPSFLPAAEQTAVRISFALTLARYFDVLTYSVELAAPALMLFLIISPLGTKGRLEFRASLSRGFACCVAMGIVPIFFLLPEQGVSVNGLLPVPSGLSPANPVAYPLLLQASLQYFVILCLISLIEWLVIPATRRYRVRFGRNA